MGLSLGGTKTSSQASGSTANTYSAGQSSLQDSLMSAFSQLLPGVASGSMSPNVTNMETANANSINQNYQGVGDQMNRYLAARGFGQSGSTGKAAMQTELGRQGALAQNASSASGQQLSFDQSLLSDALGAAFQNTGNTSTGTNSGSSFGWGASASISPAGSLGLGA
jgi:hypothetical protein